MKHFKYFESYQDEEFEIGDFVQRDEEDNEPMLQIVDIGDSLAELRTKCDDPYWDRAETLSERGLENYAGKWAILLSLEDNGEFRLLKNQKFIEPLSYSKDPFRVVMRKMDLDKKKTLDSIGLLDK